MELNSKSMNFHRFRLSFCKCHLGKVVTLFSIISVIICLVLYSWNEVKQRQPLTLLTSNDPFVYEEILVEPSKKNLRSDEKELFFLILVCSNPHNKVSEHRRNAIRNTWGNCEQLHTLYAESKHIPLNLTCKVVFYLGTSPKNNDNIMSESGKYNDMLIANYIDSYGSITKKQMLAFKWAVDLKPKFILKTDDDIFVHTPRLILKLQELVQSDNFYGGIILNRTKVVREPTHRHYVSKRQYNEEYYPPYCKGALYVVSGELLPRLMKAADAIPYMHVDDAYVGILMYYLGVTPQPIENIRHFPFVVQPFRYTINDCALKFLVAISDGLTGESIFLFHFRFKYLDTFPMICLSGTLGGLVCLSIIIGSLVFLFYARNIYI